MRTQLKVALVAAAVAVPLAPAMAATAVTTQTLSVSVSPTKVGGPPRRAPRVAAIQISGTTKNSDGSQTPVMSSITVLFAKGLTLSKSQFPSCSAAKLDSSGPSGCPAGAKIGSGTVHATAGSISTNAGLTVFNGPGQAVELYTSTDVPISIHQAVEGQLSPASSPYGTKLTIQVPENIQQPIQGVFASIDQLQISVKASMHRHGHLVSYLTERSCPANHTWPFLGNFESRDGQTLTARASVHCTALR